MKRKKYRSNVAKGISAVLLHVAAVCLVAGMILLMIFCGDVLEEIPIQKSDKPYTESSYLGHKMYYFAKDIWLGLSAQAFFEEGEQSSRVLDIEELLNDGDITWKNTSGLAMPLAELRRIAAGHPSWEELEELGKKLLAAARTDEDTLLSYDMEYAGGAAEYLHEAVQIIRQMEREMEILQEFREGNSNITYLYVDEAAKEIRTNDSSISYDRYPEILEELEKDENSKTPYLLSRSLLGECRTNLDLDVSLVQNITHYSNTVSQASLDFAPQDEFIFAVWADPEFPVQDILAENYERYEKYAPLVWPVFQGTIAAAVIFMITLIHLTIAAGRVPEDEKLHLSRMDGWYTEVMPFLLVPGYLSIVRRLKAGRFWKSSFLYQLLRWSIKILKKLWKTVKNGGALIHRTGKETVAFIRNNTRRGIRLLLLLTCFFIFQLFFCAIQFYPGAVFMDLCAIYFALKDNQGRERIQEGLKKIAGGDVQHKIDTERLSAEQKEMAEYINHIGEGLDEAVEQSLKHERLKTELITNVSHDLKTPLTSIINYADLLKRENIEDERIRNYVDILESKAQQLKRLTEDVLEASKASTGNIALYMTNMDFGELLRQVAGEFEERFRGKHLTLIQRIPEEPLVILADGQRLWRVLDNLFLNVVKYAMEGTRVYADVCCNQKSVEFSLKNISGQPLNITADELTERFIRGDISRSTEGSGLGLSIAKSLTELMGGSFSLYLDGDLFKATICFNRIVSKDQADSRTAHADDRTDK